MKNFKKENNILLTTNLKKNKLLNYENYLQTKDDYIATLFNFIDKRIILRSYLINNKKSLDITSYEKLIKENILGKENYQISIYNDLLNFNKYINTLKKNSFEQAILKELNEKLSQDILLLVSENNWFVIFDKNKLSIDNILLLKDFNKNILENNNNIYTIYSKDILTKEDNIIKQSNYNKIFSAQNEDLTFISNSLINDADIDLISKKFFNIKNNNYSKHFLNKEIDLRNPYFIQLSNASYLEKINYFFNKQINISIIEFKEIIKQTIPEITPIFFTETNLKIF